MLLKYRLAKNGQNTVAMTVWRGSGRTYNDIVTGRLWLVLKIKPDEMFRQSSITHLVNLVQDEIQEIESRNKRWGQIDISRNG